MNRNKAARIDGILKDMLSGLDDVWIDNITEIINETCNINEINKTPVSPSL